MIFSALTRGRQHSVSHPLLTLLWTTCATLLVIGSVIDSTDVHSAAIFTTVVAGVATMRTYNRSLAQHVVRRNTEVAALWLEDVRLDGSTSEEDEAPYVTLVVVDGTVKTRHRRDQRKGEGEH